MHPFRPEGPTVNIDVSSSSQSVAVASPTGQSQQVRVMNNGTATVWVEFGVSGVTASLTTSMPVGPGMHEVLTIPGRSAQHYVAAIAAGSTGKIYFTPGGGV